MAGNNFLEPLTRRGSATRNEHLLGEKFRWMDFFFLFAGAFCVKMEAKNMKLKQIFRSLQEKKKREKI